MPPQGESTGLSLEDGVLIARVFERRATRSLDQLFADYEAVRKPVIDKHYDSAVWGMNHSLSETTGLMDVFVEWVTSWFLWFRGHGDQDQVGGDVRNLELPA